MPKPDLVAEHAALTWERAELQKACMDEWATMPAQVARARQQRLLDIMDRLTAIERTKAWRGRSA
jgi:hypothetical protein